MLGRLHVARLLPLLRLLGGHAGPDVLPHRRLGRPAQALRRDQVLPVHPGRLGADAGRHPGALLLQLHAASRRSACRASATRRPSTSPQLFKIAPQIPGGLQMWIFLAFFVGFAIKVPMFPFHTWLPDAHVEAPTAGSVILAGVLLKMGTYGFVRFSLPLLPDATRQGGAVDGGAGADRHHLRRAGRDGPEGHEEAGRLLLGVATSASSCSGMFALNPAGLSGSVLQMVNHGLSTGALFLLVGIVYERRHTRMIADYGGLAKVMPVYAMLFMIITLASIGLPTLNGFVGEFTDPDRRLQPLRGVGGARRHRASCSAPPTCCGCTSGCSSARSPTRRTRPCTDVNLREQWTLIPLIVLCFWIGLYPKPFLRIMEPSIQRVVQVVDPDYLQPPGRCRRAAAAPARRAHAAPHAPSRALGGAMPCGRSRRLAARDRPRRCWAWSCSSPALAGAARSHGTLGAPRSARLAADRRRPAGWSAGSDDADGALLLRDVRPRPASRSSSRSLFLLAVGAGGAAVARLPQAARLPARRSTSRCSCSPPSA